MLNPRKLWQLMHDRYFQEIDAKTRYMCKDEIDTGNMKRVKSNWGSRQRFFLSFFYFFWQGRIHGTDIANEFCLECWLKYKHKEA